MKTIALLIMISLFMGCSTKNFKVLKPLDKNHTSFASINVSVSANDEMLKTLKISNETMIELKKEIANKLQRQKTGSGESLTLKVLIESYNETSFLKVIDPFHTQPNQNLGGIDAIAKYYDHNNTLLHEVHINTEAPRGGFNYFFNSSETTLFVDAISEYTKKNFFP